MRYPHAFAAALSPAPIGPFPPPAHRTRRADFPHRALQWDHASRTRNAEPETYAGPVVCVPPVLRSCTALPALNPVQRVARPVSALTTSGLPKMRGWPDSFAYACDASGLPALHAGILGRATPAGLRPSVIGPHLRPLSSAGITPRLQSYGPLRHPAGPAFPSRGSGCRVHGTDSASRVATHSIFHTCRRHCPGGNQRCSRCSLPAGRRPSPRCGRVGSRIGCFEACSAFTHVSARMVAEPPKAALLPECFSPRRYLRKPPWLLVCSILGYVCLICRSGSGGRPGLLGARRGERSEPERAPNRDGGRTAGRLAVRGRTEVWSPPSFPTS